MPTTATGSSTAAGTALAPSPAAPLSAPSPMSSAAPVAVSTRRVASATGVGWSKTRVGDNVRPVAAVRRLRISTAATESKPASRKVRSSRTAAAESCPRTIATCSRTRSRAIAIRSSPSSSQSRAAQAPPATGSDPAVGRSVRASGRSASTGRERAAVYVGTKRGHSMSAMTENGAPPATARRRPASPRSGSRRLMPGPWVAASSHGPQAIAVAARPRPCRRAARLARWASAIA